jgi:hypothetical protein
MKKSTNRPRTLSKHNKLIIRGETIALLTSVQLVMIVGGTNDYGGDNSADAHCDTAPTTWMPI